MNDPAATDAVARYLDRLRRNPPPPLDPRNLDAMRAAFDDASRKLYVPSTEAAVVPTTSLHPAHCPPLRVYRGSPTPRFAVLFLHGGGLVMGSLDSHDGLCRDLAAKTGAAVVSVAYRLAPEHRYPAAHDDARAALRWLAASLHTLGAKPDRIVVMGDSAGGGLAATLAQEAPRPLLQVLIYPALDYTASSPSHSSFGKGYGLDSETIDFCYRAYAPDEASRVAASVLLRRDVSDAPPAIIVVGECDPLHDEAVNYAERLNGAGVTVTLLRYPYMVHGFLGMTKLFAQARRALDDIVETIIRNVASLSPAFAAPASPTIQRS